MMWKVTETAYGRTLGERYFHTLYAAVVLSIIWRSQNAGNVTVIPVRS